MHLIQDSRPHGCKITQAEQTMKSPSAHIPNPPCKKGLTNHNTQATPHYFKRKITCFQGNRKRGKNSIEKRHDNKREKLAFGVYIGDYAKKERKRKMPTVKSIK